MSDHRAVQETETAAAGKVSELTEAMIRILLQQRAEQAKQSPGDPELFRSFYQAYQENGVDKRTARDAAADAAMGLGSKDSPAMAKAEAQAISHARKQAKEYRSVTATAVAPEASKAEQQQANVRRKDIERSLGIQDQPLKVRAQTIKGLDPNGKQPRQELQTGYQDTLQQHGVSSKTAAAASKDLTNGKGAVDSSVVAKAEQEATRHSFLKHMYQSVFEKHGVSPEVAAAAADQLAKGGTARIVLIKCAEPISRHWRTLGILSRFRLPKAQSPKRRKTTQLTLPRQTRRLTNHLQALSNLKTICLLSGYGTSTALARMGCLRAWQRAIRRCSR